MGADADVTVVMPARDPDPRHFRRAIGSTLRSRGLSLRVVVVDHGSAVPLVVRDPRVDVIRVDRALPFALAQNVGVDAARTAFLARMDADDVMHPDRLRLQVEGLVADPTLAVVSSRIKVLPKTTLQMRGHVLWQNHIVDDDAHLRERFIDQPLCHPASTMRRDVVVGVGGYVAGDFPEDYDLFLRLLSSGARFGKLTAIHHGWRQHEGQATRRVDRDVLARLKARHLVADFGLAARDVVVVGAGKEGRRISRALRGEGAVVAAFVDVDPKKVGRTTHGVPVHPPGWLNQRPAGAFVIGAVGTSGARGAIRGLFEGAGLVDGKDAICVA